MGFNFLKIFYLICLLMTVPFVVKAGGFQNEDLKYVISYKWGLIHKDAGEATLSLRQAGGNYNVTLTARTKPWADRFY